MKKRIITIPSEQYALLRSLDFTGCDPLVRFPGEGPSFESRDVLWLMKFINAKIVAEGMQEDALSEYGERLKRLRDAIRRGCHDMLSPGEDLCRELEERELKDPAGIWFSQLKDNWVMAYFLDNDLWRKREIDRYHKYGTLPDGRHYGAHLFPYRELDEHYTHIRIVEPTGESHLAVHAGLGHSYPLALAASPDGTLLAWIFRDDLMVWRKGEQEFESDGCCSLSERLENRKVKDAMIRRDGILQILLEDGASAEYSHETDEIAFL